MVKVSIAGATGYTGIELLRLLQGHPEVEIKYVGTESYQGQSIASVYPHLQTIVDLKGVGHDAAEMAEASDVVFTALPHGISQKMAPVVLQRGKKLIDLGADFRLKNSAVYEKWYQHKLADDHLWQQAVYGLPEAGYRTIISQTALLANPGCYPTSCVLAALPAIKNKLIETQKIIFDCKSGISGAGRSLSLETHFSEVTENFKAYHIAGLHRHTPEIEQVLSAAANEDIFVQFTPHLVPMIRGILTTAYLPLKKNLSAKELWEIYESFYKDEPFVRLQMLGDLPQTKQVSGSNYCDIGLAMDERTHCLIVISVIDNLIKGAAGQAIQNMNLMFGLPETMGLKQLIPVYP